MAIFQQDFIDTLSLKFQVLNLLLSSLVDFVCRFDDFLDFGKCELFQGFEFLTLIISDHSKFSQIFFVDRFDFLLKAFVKLFDLVA